MKSVQPLLSTLLLFIAFFSITVNISGCNFWSSEDKDAQSITREFWEALKDEDMKTVLSLSTPDSASFLRYMNQEQDLSHDFAVGGAQIKEGKALVNTTLYSGINDEMPVPVTTTLVKVDEHWRVDAKRTLNSIVGGTMGAILNKLSAIAKKNDGHIDDSLKRNIESLEKSVIDTIEGNGKIIPTEGEKTIALETES